LTLRGGLRFTHVTIFTTIPAATLARLFLASECPTSSCRIRLKVDASKRFRGQPIPEATASTTSTATTFSGATTSRITTVVANFTASTTDAAASTAAADDDDTVADTAASA